MPADHGTPNTGDEHDREVEADHEAGIEAALRALRDVGWDGIGLKGDVEDAIGAYLSRVSPSRGGTVAVEDVRDVLLRIGERVMTFGGFQRTPRGEFWVARDDVLRLVDELLDEFGVSERTERIHDQATKEEEQ